MLRRVALSLLLAALPAFGLARADSACLPSSLFPKDESESAPTLELGLVGGVPTLCALPTLEQAGLMGCWSVNPANGTLSRSAATTRPGISQRGKTDARGCIDGYCIVPRVPADEFLLWAASTSGTGVVIRRERALYVFDAGTKAQVRTIQLYEENAPDGTNVSNEPVRLLYVGDTIYVIGSDAGPFMAVWAFKETGERTGVVTTTGKPGSEALSVYLGAANVIDDKHVAFSDVGLRRLLILSPGGTRQEKVRAVSTAPCTKDEMQPVDIGEIDAASKACRRTLTANLVPYFSLVPVRLPSGDFLAALAGKLRGSIAILDGTTLKEKKRFKLARCTR